MSINFYNPKQNCISRKFSVIDLDKGFKRGQKKFLGTTFTLLD